MSTRTVIESDISGRPGAVTTSVGLAGQWHEVDLTETEQDELQKVLTPYLSVGRCRGTSLTKRHAPDMTVEQREMIRDWARSEGYKFSAYGRIPKKILAAYREAHESA